MAGGIAAPTKGLLGGRRVKLPGFLVTSGEMVHLGGKCVAALVLPDYGWVREYVDQLYILMRRCLLPCIIANFFFAFSIDPPAGQIVQLLGTVDRLGSFYVNAAVREFGPFITAMVIAGVGGCAATADLGARKVRLELSALESLAIDPIKELVAARWLSLFTVTIILTIFGALIGIVGGAVGVLMFGEPVSGFLSTFGSNFTIYDLVAMPMKVSIFGLMIATVSCYMGLHVSGGAEGVGRAVNRGVVISFLGIWAVDFAFSAILLALYPQVSTLR
jgi:phospholipid/cholesterol/gamma-HCH transport system permease protein